MDRLAELHAAYDGPVPPAELGAERASRRFDPVDHARRTIAWCEKLRLEYAASARKCRERGDLRTAGTYWHMAGQMAENIAAAAEIIKRGEK